MTSENHINEALEILAALGFPKGQLNERSALTLLALLELKPAESWDLAKSPLLGITPIMDFMKQQYGKRYAANTRETVRRQTVHQFLDAGLIVVNPDNPERPVNSPKTAYQIEESALELLRTYGSSDWDKNVRTYLASVETLKQRYAQEREAEYLSDIAWETDVWVAEDATHLVHFNGQHLLQAYSTNQSISEAQ